METHLNLARRGPRAAGQGRIPGRWRRRRPPPRTRRSSPPPTCSSERADDVLAANAADLEAAAAGGMEPGPARPPAPHRRPDRRHGRRPAPGRRPARSGRRGPRRVAPAQRSRDPAGPGAARRGGDHLREPPQRDQRRRRSLPQVRQRRPARGARRRRCAPTWPSPPLLRDGIGQGRPARGLRAPRRRRLPRDRRRAHAADRLRRLPDPPGRPVADPSRSATTPRCPSSSTATATATSTSTPPPTSTGRSTSSSTPRPSGPSVCNAAESLLVHEAVADALPAPGRRRARPPPASSWSATTAPAGSSPAMGEATDDDFGREFLALKMSVARRPRPRRRHRPREPVRHRPHRGDRHRATSPPPAASSARSTPAP